MAVTVIVSVRMTIAVIVSFLRELGRVLLGLPVASHSDIHIELVRLGNVVRRPQVIPFMNEAEQVSLAIGPNSLKCDNIGGQRFARLISVLKAVKPEVRWHPALENAEFHRSRLEPDLGPAVRPVLICGMPRVFRSFDCHSRSSKGT